MDGLNDRRAIRLEICGCFVDKHRVCVVVEFDGVEWVLPQVFCFVKPFS